MQKFTSKGFSSYGVKKVICPGTGYTDEGLLLNCYCSLTIKCLCQDDYVGVAVTVPKLSQEKVLSSTSKGIFVCSL